MVSANDTNDAFIREVDEEVRRDRLLNLWRRYGRLLLIGIGLFLIALAAFLYWREERARAAGELGEQFMQALTQLEGGNTAAATPTLDKLAAADRPGYEALAKLTQAGIAAQNGQTEQAAKLYRAIAADEALAQPFRDLATLKALRLDYDTQPPAKLIEQLRPLAQAGNPWFGTAGEMLAVAYIRDGKPELAGPLFATIARDPNVPPSLRLRAGQMAGMLGAAPDGASPAAPATGAAPAPAAPVSPTGTRP